MYSDTERQRERNREKERERSAYIHTYIHTCICMYIIYNVKACCGAVSYLLRRGGLGLAVGRLGVLGVLRG